jgi:hypothetical protein
MAVDANDNLYSAWTITNVCQINSQTYSDAANARAVYKKVAGGRTCGFAGDGGQARNAEIGKSIGQITFDIAGNLYFTDTANQRVRRIDASTGIIHTVAGTGTAGYSGDGGPANQATIRNPTGVTVDSRGAVYLLSTAASTGTAQVIRKIGPNGALSFGNQLKATASATKYVTVSNVGNANFTLTKAQITGTNAADFSIDTGNSSCSVTAGSSLANGQNCKIGLIFKPGASGTRSATLVFLDNTVTNMDTVLLSGVGTLPAAKVAASAHTFDTGVTSAPVK